MFNMNIRHKFTSKKFLIVLKYLRYEYKTSLKNQGVCPAAKMNFKFATRVSAGS